MKTSIKPPTSFWIVAILALLWNIFEIYFSSFELNFIEQNSTVEEFEMIQSVPFWYTIVFLVALLSEMLGTVMLFIRKKIATLFYAISFVTLLFVEFYWLFYFEIKNASTIISVVIPIAVIAIAGFLYFYSKYATKKGWLT